MEEKNIIARIGNFEVVMENGDEFGYLRIRSVSGDWEISYREDSEMYGKIMAMAKDVEYTKTLELTIIHLYHTTTILIDAQFAMDFLVALQAMYDRMIAKLPEPTEEEEQTAIEEASALLTAQEILKEAEK